MRNSRCPHFQLIVAIIVAKGLFNSVLFNCADGGWSSGQDWQKDTEINKATQANKDGEIIVYSDPAKVTTEAQASPSPLCTTRRNKQTISQLDADTQTANSEGKREERSETMAERETVKREKGSWQCVGGSSSSSFGEAFCWQQDRHLSSHPLPVCPSHWHVFK